MFCILSLLVSWIIILKTVVTGKWIKTECGIHIHICTAWIVLKYNQIVLQAAKNRGGCVCAALSIWQVVPLHRDCLKPWKYKLYPGCLLSPTMFCCLLRTHDDNALCDPCGGCSDNLKLGSPALTSSLFLGISHISVHLVQYIFWKK